MYQQLDLPNVAQHAIGNSRISRSRLSATTKWAAAAVERKLVVLPGKQGK
jgi:hypothetical protein